MNEQQLAALKSALEALEWMVANDDTNEGDEPIDRLGGQSWNEYNSYWLDGLNNARTAITAIKAALSQPAPTVQEPVGLEIGKRLIVVDQSFDDLLYWLGRCEDKGHLENCPDLLEPWRSFQYDNYTPAAQPAPVPLTDDARGLLVVEHLGPNALLHKPMSIYDAFHMGIDAAEAAHGITKGQP